MIRVLALVLCIIVLVGASWALTEVQCSRWARRRPAAALLSCVAIFVAGCVVCAAAMSALRP